MASVRSTVNSKSAVKSLRNNQSELESLEKIHVCSTVGIFLWWGAGLVWSSIEKIANKCWNRFQAEWSTYFPWNGETETFFEHIVTPVAQYNIFPVLLAIVAAQIRWTMRRLRQHKVSVRNVRPWDMHLCCVMLKPDVAKGYSISTGEHIRTTQRFESMSISKFQQHRTSSQACDQVVITVDHPKELSNLSATCFILYCFLLRLATSYTDSDRFGAKHATRETEPS